MKISRPVHTLRCLFICFALGLMHASAAAQMQTESIRLYHKPAEDIIPLVKPFLEKGAAISGRDKLIAIKTTPKNMAELKKLIADFDTPVHTLQIYVSFNPRVMQENKPQTLEDKNNGTIRPEAAGQAGSGNRYYTTKGERIDADLYTLQVLEDHWATIRTGQSIPIVERRNNADGTVTQSVRYRQINSGFHVKPNIYGDEVTLAVSVFDAKQSAKGGGTQQHYTTTSIVKLKIDQWTPLSARSGEALTTKDGNIYQTQRYQQQTRPLFMKIEIIPHE